MVEEGAVLGAAEAVVEDDAAAVVEEDAVLGAAEEDVAGAAEEDVAAVADEEVGGASEASGAAISSSSFSSSARGASASAAVRLYISSFILASALVNFSAPASLNISSNLSRQSCECGCPPVACDDLHRATALHALQPRVPPWSSMSLLVILAGLTRGADASGMVLYCSSFFSSACLAYVGM